MKLKLIPIGVCVVCAVRGGPAEQAIVAAMRLAEEPNYSWITSVTDDARSYDLEGRTQKGGYTWMRFPMIKEISLRLGRDADRDFEAVFKGTAPAVIRTETGWKTMMELPRPSRDWDDDPFLWPTPPPTVLPTGMGGGRMGRNAMNGSDPFGLPPLVIPWPTHMVPEEERKPYSNLQFAVSHPHEELAVIVSSAENFQPTADGAIGTLSDVGAQLLLVHDGQANRITPLIAAGNFKLHIKGGIVTRYSVQLEGILLVEKKKILVHQSSSTMVRDIGTSGFDVTDEIKRRLGQ